MAVFDEPGHLEWERSGIAGVGDVIALTELESHLQGIKLKDYAISYAHRLKGDAVAANLVLIGGADSNRITRRVMERLPLTIVFNDPDKNDVSFLDKLTGEVLKCRNDEDGSLKTDQGIIVRAPNPFNSKHQILIVAGSYGHGSTAAVRLLTSAKFLSKPIVQSGVPLEIYFTTEIVEHAPQEAAIQKIRQIHFEESALQ